tara:strand:+ start:40 stop:369 length:330 start_codon:yes stop_codon:yes gene_type:complete
MESNGNNSPLFLVFYLDREMMQSEMMQGFADQVNNALVQKDANAMAFFIPTDGEERIECINPALVEKTEMGKINKIIEDIKNSFDIGNGADEGKNNPDNIIDVKKISKK